MIASCSGSPLESTATVPDHCEVTEMPTMRSTGVSPTGETVRSRRRRVARTMPDHQSAGRCCAPPPTESCRSTGSNSPSTNSPAAVNNATFGPDVPRSTVRISAVGPLSLKEPDGACRAEEAALRPGVGVIVVGNVPHVVVDVVLEGEMFGNN